MGLFILLPITYMPNFMPLSPASYLYESVVRIVSCGIICLWASTMPWMISLIVSITNTFNSILLLCGTNLKLNLLVFIEGNGYFSKLSILFSPIGGRICCTSCGKHETGGLIPKKRTKIAFLLKIKAPLKRFNV